MRNLIAALLFYTLITGSGILAEKADALFDKGETPYGDQT